MDNILYTVDDLNFPILLEWQSNFFNFFLVDHLPHLTLCVLLSCHTEPL